MGGERGLLVDYLQRCGLDLVRADQLADRFDLEFVSPTDIPGRKPAALTRERLNVVELTRLLALGAVNRNRDFDDSEVGPFDNCFFACDRKAPFEGVAVDAGQCTDNNSKGVSH